MKITKKETGRSALFKDLAIGQIFSYDDYSGLYIKISEKEMYDFVDETVYTEDAYAKVVKRTIEVVIVDEQPYEE